MRGTVRSIATTTLLALVFVPAAAAAETRATTVTGLRDPLPQLRLTDGQLGWVDSFRYRSSDSGRYVIFTKPANGRTRVAARILPIRRARRWAQLDFDWDVSRSAYVVRRDDTVEDPNGDDDTPPLFFREQLVSGPFGRAPSAHPSCKGPRYVATTPNVRLDGQTMAAFPPCAKQGLTVTDLEHPDSPVSFAAADAGDSLDLSGDFVAFEPVSTNQIQVANWRTGAVAYTVDLGAEAQNLAYAFDLQSNGKLLVSIEPSTTICPTRLSWFSPAEPSAHNVPVETCSLDSQLAGDRIAYLRGKDEAGPADVAVANLDGSASTTLASFADVGQVRALAFDGERAAWMWGRCTDTAISLASAGSTSSAARPPAKCPAVVSGRTFRVDGAGAVVVPLRCPRGCRAVEVSLALPTGNDGGLTNVGIVRAGGRVRPVIRLGRGAAGRVRRRGSVRADLTVTYSNADGRTVRRTLRVTLRA